MKNDALLSISELARFARTSRTALIHYDRIGLVRPAERGDNNYRYYSHNQIASTNLISTLQSLGMSLKEIMELAESRTPEVMLDLFSRQSKFIDGEIGRLKQSQKLLMTLKKMLEIGLSADENDIRAVEEDDEAVFPVFVQEGDDVFQFLIGDGGDKGDDPLVVFPRQPVELLLRNPLEGDVCFFHRTE